MLPSEVSVLAEAAGGAPISLLVTLRRNARDQVDVRVAEGAQVYDGRRVWQVERGEDGTLSVLDRVTQDRQRFAAGANPRMLALVNRTVYLQGPEGTLGCSMKDGRCGLAEPPPLHLSHPGPGEGFRLRLDGGELRLFLPREEPGGVELASGVARLVGVYWVKEATGEADQAVNRTFRGRARVRAVAGPARADGDLHDWSDATPLVVEAAWELQAGADGWAGPSDGSFSIAASWTAEAICLAGRVRDDHRQAGDELVLHLADVEQVIPLGVASAADPYVTPEWLGASWETCVPTARLPSKGTLPFAATLVDVDPGEAETVLASAPESEGVPLGELVLDAPAG